MAIQPGQNLNSGNSDPRPRRDRANIRDLLLESATTEFAQKGFDGASTTSIAKRADAHQPQINYHFSSKAELWRAVVDRLFVELRESFIRIRSEEPSARLASMVQVLVTHSSERPELAQIMMHEAAAATERLDWITETYVRSNFNLVRSTWDELTELGIAAPISSDLVYYILVGAATMPFTNHAEARLLIKTPTSSPEFVDEYAAGLLTMLLPEQASPADQ